MAWLVLRNIGTGREFPLPAPTGRLRIGRSPECEIRIDDARASRVHTELTVGADSVEVKDLGSRNGTWVNDRRIEGQVRVAPGDRIRIGRTEFLLAQAPQVSGRRSSVLVWAAAALVFAGAACASRVLFGALLDRLMG